MAKKIQASILGKDINLLKNVAKRVVKDRPADVKYFTEVKEFLLDTIQNKPDIVAISVNYPHKNANKLPGVFKKALKIPVIVFGEDQESKTRKNLSVSSADYKISGVLTAHNFWMKLCNFQKQNEKINAGTALSDISTEVSNKETNANKQNKVSTEVEKVDHFGPLNKELDESLDHVMNKSAFDKLLDQDENSIIDSLFAQLGAEADSEEKSSNVNMITSITPDDQNKKSNDKSSEDENKKNSASDDVGSGLNIVSSDDSTDKIKSSSHIHWNEVEDGPVTKKEKSQANMVNLIDGDSVESEDYQEMDLEDDKRTEFDPDDLTSGSLIGQDAPEDEEAREKLAPEKSNKPKLAEAKKENESLENDLPNKKEPINAPEVDAKGRVKLTDEKALKEREIKKQKEQQIKDEENFINIFKEACDESMDIVFASKNMEEPRGFEATQVSAFMIETSSTKGFLIITESFNQGFEDYMLEDIRNSIIEKIKSKGQAIEISSPYRIKIPRADYIEVVKESCEFSIYKEEEMGKQLVLSYLKREVTQPQYEDSDKEGMITVDMKTIPPQTPVNFDAFIYLPRNKRLVRYLKDGRCLSLKQVKRHIEEEVPCKLYIPKKDKPKLIQFFIENTIGWEFISHTTEDKKVS